MKTFSQASTRWQNITKRARTIAEQRRKRCRKASLRYLRKALPEFDLTSENVGYHIACARNWFLSRSDEEAQFAHKAIALWDDWSADSWADAVSRKAWNRYVTPTI